ncbi:MAG: 30S ribosome-binding factor RbfA [Clostridia bacterium]|nr:30S ribosome-binding factor RbfA [Clostridiales bacterium]MDD7165124.1 30S ribosome-binding factor RbfA [Clostridia bacterium]MDY2900964.1 30S ribosome-binding factor RbfA [Christensenellaceae bacterium]
MKEKREKRLNSEFQKEIYSILKNKIKNPAISEMFSISEVDVTNDLKHAKVFVSVFSTDKAKAQVTFEAICASAKAVRTELSKTMHIRTVPELHFVTDNSTDYGNKIDNILSTLTYVTSPDDESETDNGEIKDN